MVVVIVLIVVVEIVAGNGGAVGATAVAAAAVTAVAGAVAVDGGGDADDVAYISSTRIPLGRHVSNFLVLIPSEVSYKCMRKLLCVVA